MTDKHIEKTLELTYNLAKPVIRKSKVKRVPKAIRKLQIFIAEHTNVKTVKLDPTLNKFCWSKGKQKVPRKVRILVKIERVTNDEGVSMKVARAEFVPVTSFKGLQHRRIEITE